MLCIYDISRGAGEKKTKNGGTYLPTFFEIFWDFQVWFKKIFLWCFWGPHAEKRPKTRLKKIDGKRRKEKSFFSQLFRPKVFDMDFPQKVFYGVLNSPCWETHKNAIKTISKIKKIKRRGGTYLPDLSSARYTSLSFVFFYGAPRPKGPKRDKRKKEKLKPKLKLSCSGDWRSWLLLHFLAANCQRPEGRAEPEFQPQAEGEGAHAHWTHCEPVPGTAYILSSALLVC